MTTIDIQIGDNADDVVHRGSDHTLSINASDQLVGNVVADPGDLHDSAFRFIGITIPSGSTIDAARLDLVAKATASGTVVRTNIRAHAADNSGQIANDTDWHNVVDANLTSALTAWDNIAAWTIEDAIQSLDFKAVVQELLDGGFLASGVAHIFLLNDISDFEAFRDAYAHDATPGKAATLHVEFTEAVAVATKGSTSGPSWLIYR